MQPLAVFDGVWRGNATVMTAGGQRQEILRPATIRYAAVVENGVWKETGERVVEGELPTKIFEMSLKRTGSTDWPSAGAPDAR